jgi:hypothetical protein
MTMIALSNEKFLTSRTDNGFVVLCDGHKLTRDDLTFGTARLIAAAPDLLDASAQLVVSRLQMMAIHPSHYASLAHMVRNAAPKTPKDA